METLGIELKNLGLACTIASFDPEDSSLVIRYVSIESKVLSAIEKIVERPVSGFRLALKTSTSYRELIEHHRAIVVPGSEVVSFATVVLPGFTRPIINRIMKLAGVQPDTEVIFLPLVIEDRLLGAFWLWGQDLQETDLPMFSTFASQMSIIMENARLFEQVHAGRERLRDLSRRLVQIQEAERRFIAHELHDEVGQSLTGLKLLLDSITEVTEATADKLQRAQSLAEELMNLVQDLSLDLRPPTLDDLGLLPTLTWHIQRYSAQTGMDVDIKHRGLRRRFPSNVEIAAYRIVQEALTNVARHAGVDKVTVHVWFNRKIKELCIQVEDQGSGFDYQAAIDDGRASGLIGMQERVVLLGGRLEINSAPGRGTALEATLPLEERIERRWHER